jgi:hypothetical protein
MNENTANKIAAVFQSNLGNRITLELANGMLSEIIKLLPQSEEANVDTTTANPGNEVANNEPESISKRGSRSR